MIPQTAFEAGCSTHPLPWQTDRVPDSNNHQQVRLTLRGIPTYQDAAHTVANIMEQEWMTATIIHTQCCSSNSSCELPQGIVRCLWCARCPIITIITTSAITWWPSGTVPDLQSRGRGFESRPWLLSTRLEWRYHEQNVAWHFTLLANIQQVC